MQVLSTFFEKQACYLIIVLIKTDTIYLSIKLQVILQIDSTYKLGSHRYILDLRYKDTMSVIKKKFIQAALIQSFSFLMNGIKSNLPMRYNCPLTSTRIKPHASIIDLLTVELGFFIKSNFFANWGHVSKFNHQDIAQKQRYRNNNNIYLIVKRIKGGATHY